MERFRTILFLILSGFQVGPDEQKRRAQKRCRHKFDYMREMTGRDWEGNVSCRCHKCGGVFKADCGLNLPGTLIQKP
jgi:hypothetical protein